MYYVYVLQSLSDGSRFYLGWSSNLRKRLAAHNAGKNKATKGSQWRLVYYEAWFSEQAAIKREYKLKHDGRSKRRLMERIKASLEQ